MSEAIDVLKSIDAKLEAILRMVTATMPKPVADDSDLDSERGDPEVKAMPNRWKGPSYKDRHFSECPLELLEMLADMHDYFGDKAEAEKKTTANGKPTAPYERAKAARARGWAKRIRDGRHTPKPVPTGSLDVGDDNEETAAPEDPEINW